MKNLEEIPTNSREEFYEWCGKITCGNCIFWKPVENDSGKIIIACCLGREKFEKVVSLKRKARLSKLLEMP